MKRYAIAYIATGIVFLAIDAVWLTTMAQRLYWPLIGDILAERINPVPAVLFYVIYVTGIMIFATRPAFADGKWTTAALHGALFGFFAYATYDLTNHATLRNWPAIITIADICWGTLLTALSATIGFAVTKRFSRNA